MWLCCGSGCEGSRSQCWHENPRTHRTLTLDSQGATHRPRCSGYLLQLHVPCIPSLPFHSRSHTPPHPQLPALPPPAPAAGAPHPPPIWQGRAAPPAPRPSPCTAMATAMRWARRPRTPAPPLPRLRLSRPPAACWPATTRRTRRWWPCAAKWRRGGGAGEGGEGAGTRAWASMAPEPAWPVCFPGRRGAAASRPQVHSRGARDGREWGGVGCWVCSEGCVVACAQVWPAAEVPEHACAPGPCMVRSGGKGWAARTNADDTSAPFPRLSWPPQAASCALRPRSSWATARRTARRTPASCCRCGGRREEGGGGGDEWACV